MRIIQNRIALAKEIAVESMKKHLVPGMAMAIFISGKTTDILTTGYADPSNHVPVKEATHFEAASLTKPVFSRVIYQLVKEGVLDLDTPVSDYAPEAAPSEDARIRSLTPRHILCHSSGLPDWGDAPLPLSFTPGNGFGYSGKGYTFLQEAVEKITARRIDDLMQQMLFLPLHMEDAAMIWTGPLNRTLARTVDTFGALEPVRSSCRRTVALEPNAAFSLYVTIRDYPKFIEAILSDSDFLSMVTSAANPAGHGVTWGLGFGMYKDLLWHWGDNGGFKSLVLLDPSTKDGLLIHTNGTNGLDVCFDTASFLCGNDLSDIQKMISEAE